MKKYLQYRILKYIISIFLFSLFLFLLLKLVPGDPVQIILMQKGIVPDVELMEQLREQWGLNRNYFVQYFDWIYSILKGNWGISYLTEKPIIFEISHRYIITLRLLITSCILTIPLGIAIGFYTGIKENKIFDKVFSFLSTTIMGLPLYWGGLLLMFVFGVVIPIFPVTYNDNIYSYIMPISVLVIFESSNLARLVRSYVIQYKDEFYIKAATYRGVKMEYIIRIYLFKSVAFQIFQLTINSCIHLLGGTIIIESVFGFPGIGKFLIDTINQRDFPVIQVLAFFMAMLSFSLNLVIDILQKYKEIKEGRK